MFPGVVDDQDNEQQSVRQFGQKKHSNDGDQHHRRHVPLSQAPTLRLPVRSAPTSGSSTLRLPVRSAPTSGSPTLRLPVRSAPTSGSPTLRLPVRSAPTSGLSTLRLPVRRHSDFRFCASSCRRRRCAWRIVRTSSALRMMRIVHGTTWMKMTSTTRTTGFAVEMTSSFEVSAARHHVLVLLMTPGRDETENHRSHLVTRLVVARNDVVKEPTILPDIIIFSWVAFVGVEWGGWGTGTRWMKMTRNQ